MLLYAAIRYTYTLYAIRYTVNTAALEGGTARYKKVSTAANQAKGLVGVNSSPAAEPKNPTDDKNNFLESNKFQPTPVKVV